MRTALTLTVLFTLLAGAILWAVYVWTSVEDAPISGHGQTALVLMVIFTLIVGGGLMALVFYSNRKGYDQPPEIDEDRD